MGGDKPVPWWDGPKPEGKVSGTLKQVDCLPKQQARLSIEDAAHKLVKLLVADPSKVVYMGNGEVSLGCGVQKPRKIHRRVFPESQRQAGHRRRGCHHRVPVTTASGQRRRALPLGGARRLRALHRHQLSWTAPRSPPWRPLLKQEFDLDQRAVRVDHQRLQPDLCGQRAVRRDADRLASGLNRVISIAVGLWSFAGIATGFTRGLGGLVGCRAVLGVAEAAGIPAAGKAIHKYLLPGERARATRSTRRASAWAQWSRPLLATWIAVRSGWRARLRRDRSPRPRLDSAVELGLAPRAGAPSCRKQHGGAAMLRDRRLWVFVDRQRAQHDGLLSSGSTGPRTTWCTSHRLTLRQAVWYVWIPPVFAAAAASSAAGSPCAHR